MTRREFLKTSSIAAAGAASFGLLSSPPAVHSMSHKLPNPDKVIASLKPGNYGSPEVLEQFGVDPDAKLWDPDKDWITNADWESIRSRFAGETIRFAVGAADAESVRARKEPFEKLSGMTVEIISIPDESFYDKAITEFVAGTGRFDATEYFAPWLGDFSEPGFLHDLTDWVDKWDYPLDDFYETYKTYSYYGDEGIFGLPYDCDFQMLQARSKTFTEITGESIDPKTPIKTWDDVVDYARQCNAPDKDRYGVGLMAARGFWSTYTWFHIAAQYGLDLFNSDWKPQINSEAGIAGIQKMMELKEHAPPGVTSWGWPDNRGSWLGGNLVLNVAWQEQGNQALRRDQSTIVDDDPITLYEPFGTGPEARFAPPNIAGSTASVSATAKKPEAAFLLVAFYTSAAPQALNAINANGVCTGYKNVIQNEDYQKINPPAKVWKEELPYAWAEPRIPGMFKMEVNLGHEINNVLSGMKSPQEALQAGAERWEYIMEREGFYRGEPPIPYESIKDRLWLGEGKQPPR